MKPIQLVTCIHAAMRNGLNAEELAEVLCTRFGGESLPEPEALKKGMEEIRGVESSMRANLEKSYDG